MTILKLFTTCIFCRILCNIQFINSFQQLKIVKTAAFWVCLKLFSQFSHLHFVYFILILLILHFFNFQKKEKKKTTRKQTARNTLAHFILDFGINLHSPNTHSRTLTYTITHPHTYTFTHTHILI